MGQKEPIEILTTFLHRGSTPHAILFSGINGVGKKAAAKLFSMALNCQGNHPGLHQSEIPCGSCRSCGKIKSGNHPDMIFIKPTGTLIRIAQIRELLETLSLKPYEATVRVVVILDAQTMNPEAANALLKMLEEPPDRTIFILTTEQPVDLLPTVVSRCQQIRFRPVLRDDLKRLLIEKHSVATDTAQAIAGMANGSFSKAVDMSQSNWLNKRNWLIGEMESLGSRPLVSVMTFAEKLSKDNAALPESLDILMTWFRDVLIYMFSPQNIINKDLIQRIQSANTRLSIQALLSKIEDIHRTQRDIHANANLRLAVDTLFFRLAKG